MPEGSYLVNTARGGLVDEAALRRAITREHLRGQRWTCSSMRPTAAILCRPAGGDRDTASRRRESWQCRRMVERSAANIGRFLAGEPVQDVIPGLPGELVDPVANDGTPCW